MPYEEMTVGRLYMMKVNWYLAGLRFCTKIARDAPGRELQAMQNHCASGVDQCHPYLEHTGALSKGDWSKHWKSDRSEENQLFAMAVAAASAERNIPADDAVAMLKNCYIRLLNGFEWNVISKPVTLEGRQWLSRITPMNRHYADRVGGAGLFAAYGTTGMGSMTPRLTPVPNDPRSDQENHRITNFWMTELLLDGDPMFSGFRSGSLSGKLIGASDVNINRRNAQQLLDAVALEETYRRQHHAERFVQADDRKIMLVSINLQTGNKLGGEGSMIRGQDVALQTIMQTIEDGNEIADDALLQQLREERVAGYTIEVLSFNCEVNNIGGLTAWHNNNAEAAWTSLYNKAAFYSHALRKSSHPMAPFTRQAISALRQKFAETSKRDLLRPSNDYKIASRLAALAYLSGCHVHFNCKSGKDRTGLMDIEIKRLIASMYASFRPPNGQVVVPRYTLSGAQAKETYRTLLAQSGNFEVQEYNTGGRGFKVAQLPKLSPSDRGLAARFGKGGGLDFAYGLKGYMDIDDLGKETFAQRLTRWLHRG